MENGRQDTVLSVQGLACGYGATPVLRDVSFGLSEGGVLTLLGPNGVGKTTLFRTMLGMLSPLAGSVLVKGRPVQQLGEAELAREVAYIAQQHTPAFAFSVEQVVLMGRTPHASALSGPGPQDEAAASRAMQRLGISHLAQRDYTRLSGGERQLVMVARALAQEPALLVMDEPCAGLDLGNQALLLQQVACLAAEGMAVVMTTHDPNHAFMLDGEVLCLGREGLLAHGRAREVLTPALMQRMYGVAVAVGEVHGEKGGASATACVPLVDTGGPR